MAAVTSLPAAEYFTTLIFLQPLSFRISGCGFLLRESFHSPLDTVPYWPILPWERLTCSSEQSVQEQRDPSTSAGATRTDKTSGGNEKQHELEFLAELCSFCLKGVGRCGQNRNSIHQSGSMVTKKQRDAATLELFHSQMRKGCSS